MYYQLLGRTTLSNSEVLASQPVDVSGMSALAIGITVYTVVAGMGTPTVLVTPETSDDGEKWLALTGLTGVTAVGFHPNLLQITSAAWGRLIRVSVTVGTMTGDSAEFAVSLGTYSGT